MRDISKVLDLIANSSAMDYCEEFDEIKSVLEYCHKHVKPFNKLHFRSGNEQVINELTNRLISILVSHNYVSKESHEPSPKAYGNMRKILMFFIANTDTTYKFNLRQDENYTHITEICPLMPKFLLMALIWELKLDKFFIELLTYAPYWLSFQYFEVANESLKYIEDPYVVLIKVEQLFQALSMCISRMKLQGIDIVDCRVTCNKLYDACTNMLRLFYTPDSEKFRNFNKKQKLRYTGYVMLYLLRTVLFLFDVFENIKINEPIPHYASFYNLCANICPVVKTQKQEKISSMIKEQLHKLINAVLNSVQYNLLLVNLEAFIYWVEIDAPNNRMLQNYIGEMAYYVSERMKANVELDHDLITQLHMIALKPKTREEIIKDACLGEILLALEDISLKANEKHEWLDELISRNISLGNDECLKTIYDYIELVTKKNCKQMLDFLKLEAMRIQQLKEEDSDTDESVAAASDDCSIAPSTLTCNTPEAATTGTVTTTTTTATNQIQTIEEMQIDAADFEDITRIILHSLKNFNKSELLELLEHEMELFGARNHIFCISDMRFQQRLNKFLLKNNIIDDFDMLGYLQLCFERPIIVWQQLFQNAYTMPESLKIFCHILEENKSLAAYFIPNLLNETICDNEKLHQPLVTELFCEIYFILFHPSRSQDFLEHCMNTHITNMLENENFIGLLPLVITLNKIAKHGETQSHKPLNFGNFTCPMLLTVARILDIARWEFINYTEERYQLVCECIEFLQYNNKHFLPTASEGDRLFISTCVKDCYSYFVKYYFQKYSLSPDEQPKHFDEFIVVENCSTFDESLASLLMNITCCTKKETEWLAQTERFKPLFGEAMKMLSVIVEASEPENQTAAVQNYRRCLVNYGLVVQKFMLPAAKDNIEKLEELLFKVLKIISVIPKAIFDETFLSILWLPLEIVETYMKEINFELYKRIISYMGTISESRAKTVFCEKLEALVSK